MSVVTRAAAKADAVVVRDEVVAGANTATRVGSLIEDIVDSVVFAAEVSSLIRAEAMSDSDVASLSGLATTIDGYLFDADGEVAHLTGQTDPIENGPWTVHSGAWTRPDGYASGGSASGSVVYVVQGSTYADQTWACTTDPPNDVIDTDGTTWQQTSGQSLAATLAIGSTTLLGQSITWTGATANVVTGNSSIAGFLQVHRSGNGSAGISVVDNTQIAVFGTDLATTTTSLGALSGDLQISAAAGALSIAANTDIEIATVAGGVDIDSASYVEIGAGAGQDITLNLATGQYLRLTDAAGNYLGVTRADLGGSNYAAIVGAIGDLCAAGMLLTVTAPTTGVNGRNVGLVAGTGGTGTRAGGTAYMQAGLATGGGAEGVAEIRNAAGTALVTVSAAKVVLTAATTLDWASGTASLRIGTTAWLTSTTSLSAFAQSVSITATGAAVASAGTLRTSATYTHKSRNAAGTQDADVITLASDVLTVGEDTDIADVRIRALTSVELYAAGAMVAEAEAGVFQLQGSNKLDWVTSAVLSIGGTNIATSTTSLWSFAQAVSVTTGGAAVASTGTLRTKNDFLWYARNSTNSTDYRLAWFNSSDVLLLGDETNLTSMQLRATTTVIGNVNNTNIWITRATELELQNVPLDWSGSTATLTIAGTTIASSTTSLWAFSQAISITVSAAAVAGSGDIRHRNTGSALARNAGNTLDCRIYAFGGDDVLRVGDQTTYNTQVHGFSAVQALIANTVVGTFNASGLTVSSGLRVNFGDELKITRNGTDYITSAAGLVRIASAVTLDFAGEISVQRQTVTRLSSTSTATRINAPTSGTVDVQINAVDKIKFYGADPGSNPTTGIVAMWVDQTTGELKCRTVSGPTTLAA
jgi:hypothetical protein